jgi:hypothetical protein
VLGRQACWPAERFSRWGAGGAKGDRVAGDRDLWRSGVRRVGARGMVVGQAVVRQLASPTGPRAAGRPYPASSTACPAWATEPTAWGNSSLRLASGQWRLTTP